MAVEYTGDREFAIEFELEEDGRWIAEIPALPGVMVYGISRSEAESKVEAWRSGSLLTGSTVIAAR